MNRRRLAYRLLLAVTAPVAFLAALEAVFLVAGWGHPTRFLLRAEHDGRAVWIDNQLFGYRFFAPAVSRAPTPIVVPVEKAPDEYRVVLLGESAAMGEPEPAYGPARLLEYQLSAHFTNRRVRVINAAMTAINSHVIREIARDLPRLQPDAVILYIGNNEVVGPYGPGTVFHAHAASPLLNRLRAVATRLRAVSAFQSWQHARRGGDRTVWQGMEMFRDRRVAEDDPRLAAVYQAYENNLRAILRAVDRAGAKPVVCTVAVNLADQARLDGQPRGTDRSPAGLARERDADTLRFRADRVVNETIRRVAADHTKALFIDIEQLLHLEGPPGHNLFLDHVHFNFEGSYRVASAWSDGLAGQVPMLIGPMQRLLVWNPYNRLDIVETMLERAARPPFSGTDDHADRMLLWSLERASLYQQMAELPLDDVMRAYREVARRYPDDLQFPLQAVRALLVQNRLREAADWLEALRIRAPHRADIRSWLVVLAAVQGQTDRAWTIMTEGAPDLGELPADLLVSASETLLQGGYRDESLAVLQTVAARYPRRVRLQALLASRYAQAGRRAEAAERFAALVEAHPDAAWIREEYGILLAMSGQPAEAERLLEHLRDDPDPAQRLKWIQFLLFQRRLDDAARALEDLVRDHPRQGESLRQLAILHRQRNDLVAALAWAKRWTEAEPWRGEAWGQRGDWLDEADRPDEAIACYEKAVPLLVEPADTQRALAWLLAATGRAEQALAVIEDVAAREVSPLGYTRFVRSAALAAAGRHVEAVAEIDRALADNPAETDPALHSQLRRARETFAAGESIRR